MRLIKPESYSGDRAWAAMDIERFDAATVRMHWTDQPYKWHVNDGPEVFVLLKGRLDMHVKNEAGEVSVLSMEEGDIFHAESGDAHVAHPQGETRVLVIERPGSV
jgi:mannose-6-phosphate isomerase-like protein (cupin superfamily)